MCSTEDPTELKKIIFCQEDTICKLNRRLEEFDSVVCERNKLREIYKQCEKNHEDSINAYKKAFCELSAKCDEQTKKLKECANSEYQWELRYGKLEEANNSMCGQIQILKCNESKLKSQLAETEITLKCVQKELCQTKAELEETLCLVNTLKASLKCTEQELCKVRRELEECMTECNKLHEMNGVLTTELNCTKKCLCEAKLAATRIEERYIQERENLTCELRACCQKVSDLEMRLDDAMCKLNDERCKSKKFACKLIELNKVSASNHLEMKNRVQILEEEMCAKCNEICCLKKRIVELQQEIDCQCMEINQMKIKLYERECQLKQMIVLSEKIEQIKCFVDTCCCPKKECCPIPCCCPKKKCGPSPCGPSPCGPSPCGPSPCGPSPCGPSPCGPSPCGPSPCGPSPCGPSPCGPSPCGPSPCGPSPCGPSPCCPKKKCEPICEPICCIPAPIYCPKKKCEPKCEPNCCPPTPICCPQKKPDPCCEPIMPMACCPEKKLDPCCKPSNTKLPCGLSNSTKCMIQKYATKLNTKDNYTQDLKQLKCDMEDLQQSLGDV
ncbi:unnamed protein product [Macrosiphum euphorbiae]|uniref:Uncharacterized protein n=1 Tax=Macrosiphum euphorbiae TaxID=13131 RepID=A0AAV0WC24_9HEMI|nr:unnamed protein product [Macrosiphum euphorbiae]